jgi:hypothetical protein
VLSSAGVAADLAQPVRPCGYSSATCPTTAAVGRVCVQAGPRLNLWGAPVGIAAPRGDLCSVGHCKSRMAALHPAALPYPGAPHAWLHSKLHPCNGEFQQANSKQALATEQAGACTNKCPNRRPSVAVARFQAFIAACICNKTPADKMSKTAPQLRAIKDQVAALRSLLLVKRARSQQC